MIFQPTDTRGITRVILPRVSTCGWQVRMQRRGEKLSRFFSDSSYRDLAESYHAAKAWRDEMIAHWKNGDPVRTCQQSPRNASGVIGVSKITIKSSNGTEYYFWQATWCPSTGQKRSIRFSIRQYGHDQAYQLAVKARLEGVSGGMKYS